jgi:hypothetical protein
MSDMRASGVHIAINLRLLSHRPGPMFFGPPRISRSIFTVFCTQFLHTASITRPPGSFMKKQWETEENGTSVTDAHFSQFKALEGWRPV